MPKAIVFENVWARGHAPRSGFLCQSGFAARFWKGGLGYRCARRAMDTVCVGIPHSRRRCWVAVVWLDVLEHSLDAQGRVGPAR
eukprot:546440-Lingulodinium_polyedra.AAC.1